MNILWYFLTFVSGALGILSLVRVIERLAFGGGILPIQAAIALIFLFLAWESLKKARFRALTPKSHLVKNP
jgi:hypothetical protein